MQPHARKYAKFVMRCIYELCTNNIRIQWKRSTVELALLLLLVEMFVINFNDDLYVLVYETLLNVHCARGTYGSNRNWLNECDGFHLDVNCFIMVKRHFVGAV